VAKVLVTEQRLPNPKLVGKPATHIAEKAGFAVPAQTRVLLAPLSGVGREYPLSIEKLCPVLAFYVVKDWREACERCKQILRYGGTGHTMSIHSRNDDIILEFGLRKPAFRICVNTPTTHGSIGLTTGLDPAMTLGCGGYGGNITSDNISPRHLLNIKRLAYEVKPAESASDRPRPAPADASREKAAQSRGIAAASLTARIDEFLSGRGLGESPYPGTSVPVQEERQAPVEFVCEDDVRTALAQGRKIVVSDRTIVTPSARDLGESRRVFVSSSQSVS
jgi:acetaldehyde dehydrogenase (acetylating)